MGDVGLILPEKISKINYFTNIFHDYSNLSKFCMAILSRASIMHFYVSYILQNIYIFF